MEQGGYYINVIKENIMGHLMGLVFVALVTTVVMFLVALYDRMYKQAMYKGQWENFMNNDGLAIVIGISIIVFVAVIVGLFYVTENVIRIFGGGL